MTFLNALFLAGMAAGIVPIVIHLLQRRRLRRVEFSDLRFLAPVHQQRMRSLNLRRLLLLILRVLIIVLTAFAMARPSVRGRVSALLPAQARSSVLLLVDTSYSMRMEGENGTALDAGKAACNQLLDALERGDAVNVMTFDAAPRALFETAVHDLGLVRQKLQELQPSHATTVWPEALRAAFAAVRVATEPNVEIYVVSDFAGTLGDSLPADLAAAQGDVRLTLVPVRVEPFVNVSVEAVQVPPGAVLLDEPARVGVTVRNHATDVPADCSLKLDLAGEPKAEASLRLAAAAQQTQDFTLVATRADQLAGTVRKRADRLAEDDARYFVLPVLEQVRVLFVRAPGDAGGSFYVSRALAPAGSGRSPVRIEEVASPRLSSNDLDGVQVVVVASDAALEPSQAQILGDFVDAGGGLALLTGARAALESHNQGLLSRLGAARVRGVVEQSQGYSNLADLRPSGILAGFREPELRALERVKFTRTTELAGGGELRTVLHFGGGRSALVEGTHGGGKYMVFAFDASLDGSDLAVSPMFLPLLHRTVVYLAGETGRQKLATLVGERIEVQVPSTETASRAGNVAGDDERFAQAGVSDGGTRPAGGTPAGVTTPSGRHAAVEMRAVGRMSILSYAETAEPGHYRFEIGGRTLVRAVNVDTRESDLHPIDLGDFESKLGLRDVSVVDDPSALGRSVREARHGKELYKLIAALVLLLMTLELLGSRVARDSEA